MEAAEVVAEDLAPAQRLTPQQRAVLLEYARLGTIDLAAETLGITYQTAKNHLSDAYRRLGAVSGPQAIFLVMGGSSVAEATPPAIDRREADLAVLRARVRILENEIRTSQQRLARPPAPPDVPEMIDGQITLRQLRAASSRYDADMARTSERLMTASEWATLLSYHVRSTSPLASEAPG